MAPGFLFLFVAILIFGLDCWNWCQSSLWSPITLATFLPAIEMKDPAAEGGVLDVVQAAFVNFPIDIALGVAGLLMLRWAYQRGA